MEKTDRDYRLIIEETGGKYDDIISKEDFIPKKVYLYQIDLRNKIIDQTLSDRKFSFVLDLGCGTGFHLEALSRHAETLIGVDMSFGALLKCREKTEGNYIVCDARYLPFKDNTIDCIWTAGVLHHVPDDCENVIHDNIVRILKKGGIYLVDEPNKLNLLNYLILKLSKADPTGEERPLSVSRVEKILKMNSFTIESSSCYGLFGPFGSALNIQFLMDICQKLDELLTQSVFQRFLLRWTIYARKE